MCTSRLSRSSKYGSSGGDRSSGLGLLQVVHERVHLGEHDGQRLADPLVRLFPLVDQQEIGDVLSTVAGSSAGRTWRQPGARRGQFPRAAHLQRVEQQQDAVGRTEILDVLLDGLLGAQVLACRVEERQQGPLRIPVAEDTGWPSQPFSRRGLRW